MNDVSIPAAAMPQEFIDAAEANDSEMILGPNYFAGRKIAEAFMAQFQAEHFKPLIDKFTEQFQEAMWEQVRDYLLENTEHGLQETIWRQVDRSVEGLLAGAGWAHQKYALGKRYDCDKIRAAIAKHIPVEIQEARIADLEAELVETKRNLEVFRRRG